MQRLVHFQADPSIGFVTGLSILADLEDISYDLILAIIDRLTKMVHYNPVKVTLDAPGPVKMNLDVLVSARLNRAQ